MERTETKEVGSGAVCQSTRILIRRKWGVQWNCGQVTEGMDQMLVLMQLCRIHQAFSAAPTTLFFFIKLIWLSLFCAPAVTGAADEVLSPPSTVLSIIRDGNSSLLTRGLFSYFSGSERCCSERLENWDAFLGEEHAWLHPLTQDLCPVFIPAPCPSSGFHKEFAFWWPILRSLQG